MNESPDQQRRLDDPRIQTLGYLGTILMAAPPGRAREGAIEHFSRTVYALALAIAGARP